uniref:Uncharacterized protein n=1 Tax=Salarias fasciatus TaxID=181472 RepID=A0A672H784_SALFA
MEEQLLLSAAEGNCADVQKILQSRIHQAGSFSINCRCKESTRSVENPGWTALHLASSSGHREVVEELLKAGADVNLQNNVGDTPLHIAARTGKKVRTLEQM